MKRTVLIYWIVTGLFLAFMLFSAANEMLAAHDEVEMITGLGYPVYFIPFLGVAKVLGVIAILVPGLARLKEWAYAGFFFDLAGATYSQIARFGWMPQISFMSVFFIFLFLSYYFYHKKTRMAAYNEV